MNYTPSRKNRTVKDIAGEYITVRAKAEGYALRHTIKGATDCYDVLFTLYPIPEASDSLVCTIFVEPNGPNAIRWEMTNHPQAGLIEKWWRPELTAAIDGAEFDATPVKPKTKAEGGTKREWLDYYHAHREQGYTIKQAHRESGFSYSDLRKENMTHPAKLARQNKRGTKRTKNVVHTIVTRDENRLDSGGHE